MTRTLADMTPAERADCVGMWATYHGSVDPRPVIIWTVEGDIVWRLTFTSQLPIMGTDLDKITPRLDLPRVWTPSGEPVSGECEYAVGYVVEYADGQKDCRPRYREDSRQSALGAAEDMKDDGYVAMSRYVTDWEVAP